MSFRTVLARGPEKDFDRFLTDSTRRRLLARAPQGKSHAEETVLHVAIPRELGRRAGPDHAALLDDVMPVRDARERLEVLVDDEDRQARCLEALDCAVDLDAHERREPLGRLVEDEELRVGHERAADREHLLLAARELAAEVALAR